MTQGKKKKRAANRSIMLAKKIIIKDGGTVSAGSAPQGGPDAGPARSSPPLPPSLGRERPALPRCRRCRGLGLRPPRPGSSGSCSHLRPGTASPEPAASAHVRPASGRRRRSLGSLARPSAARGEAGQPCAPYAVAGGRYRGPLGQGTCVVPSRSPGAGTAALSCSATLSRCELIPSLGIRSLTIPGALILSFREIITLCLKITVFRIDRGVRIG